MILKNLFYHSHLNICLIFATYSYQKKKENPEDMTWKALSSFHYCPLRDFNEGVQLFKRKARSA